MEESLKKLRETFQLSETDAGLHSPLTLAYIGDAVFELIVRYLLVLRADTSVNRLHKKASALVQAASQARMAEELKESLSEEERQIYKRGRNAKSNSYPKNAVPSDYRKATGLEALLGWLFLKERYDRLIELVIKAIEFEEKTEQNDGRK